MFLFLHCFTVHARVVQSFFLRSHIHLVGRHDPTAIIDSSWYHVKKNEKYLAMKKHESSHRLARVMFRNWRLLVLCYTTFVKFMEIHLMKCRQDTCATRIHKNMRLLT